MAQTNRYSQATVDSRNANAARSTVSQTGSDKSPLSLRAAREADASESYFAGSSTLPTISDDSQMGLKEGQASDNPILGSKSLHASTASYGNHGTLGILDSTFQLPNRQLADSLIGVYFDRVHKLYPFVHEGNFRTEYETMWAQHPSRSQMPVAWYSLLNMIFAHGCEFCGLISKDEVLATAASFVSRARDILLSHIFQAGTLETVQSSLLMCYFLQGTTELTECWHFAGLMIRKAINIGLHLETGTDSLPAIERETRKRVWWGCFVLDRTLSMKFGRPPLLRAKDGNVDLPLEIDDQYITCDSATPRQPTGIPSFTSFFIATIKLADIIYNMLTELYVRRLASYDGYKDKRLETSPSRCSQILSKIMILDGQLQSWWDYTPRHLTQVFTEGEESRLDFQRQRVVLKIR